MLAARWPDVFGKGFRIRAIGPRLYVQLSGRRVPLYLDFDADPQRVRERALALLRLRRERGSDFDSQDWRDLAGAKRVKESGLHRGTTTGSKARPTLESIEGVWGRFKRAQGTSEATIERHYFVHIRRMDSIEPFSDASLLGVIEATDPRGPTRRRVVAFLRQLCRICGQDWNSALLDPLQNAGMAVQHRPQAFLSDAQIEAIVAAGLAPAWQRVVVLLAVYGLRPWEAWVAVASKERSDCLWVPSGKTNRHGTTPPRQVPPFHPQWYESFRVKALLSKPLPGIRDLSQAGSRVNQHLRRHGLLSGPGQSSYGFRHAYARRLHSPQYRVTDAHAALFMGHTVAAHHKAYRSWLGEEDPIGTYLESPG